LIFICRNIKVVNKLLICIFISMACLLIFSCSTSKNKKLEKPSLTQPPAKKLKTEGVNLNYKVWIDKSKNDKSKELDRVLLEIWQERKEYWKKTILKDLIRKQNSYVLYNIQIELSHMLLYAHKSNNLIIYDDCAGLMLLTLKGLKEVKQMSFRAGATQKLLQYKKPYKMWLNLNKKNNTKSEVTLTSSQFLFAVAQGIHLFSEIPKNKQSDTVKEFLKLMPSVILSHYSRWAFNTKQWHVLGWGCSDGFYTHHEFVKKKLTRSFGDKRKRSYCNAVTDQELWITAGLAELLSSKILLGSKSSEVKKLKTHLELCTELFESRISETRLTNFNGKFVKGINFDIGAWDDHPDHAFQGYSTEALPDFSKKKPVKNSSWDLSHAGRFVFVFGSIDKNKKSLGLQFRNDVMEKLSNQVAYKIFNGDFKNPLFSNFFDGRNGWYRFNRKGKKRNSGAFPSRYSRRFITKGYLLLGEYNPDITKIGNSILECLSKGENNRFYFKLYSDNAQTLNEVYMPKTLCFFAGLNSFK